MAQAAGLARPVLLPDLPPHLLQHILIAAGSGAAAAACACSALRATFDALLADPASASRFLASRYCLATAVFYLHAMQPLRNRLVPRAAPGGNSPGAEGVTHRAGTAATAPSRPSGGAEAEAGATAGTGICDGEEAGEGEDEGSKAARDAAVARVEAELLRMGAPPGSVTLDGFVRGMFEVAVAKDSPYCDFYADVCMEIQPLVPGLPPSYTRRPSPVRLETLLTQLCRTELAAGVAAIRAGRERARLRAKAAAAAAAAADAEAETATAAAAAGGASAAGQFGRSKDTVHGAGQAEVHEEDRDGEEAAAEAARRRALAGCLFAGQLFKRGLLLGSAPLHGFVRELVGGQLAPDEASCLCKLLRLVGQEMEEADYPGGKGYTAMYEYYDKMWYACDFNDYAMQTVLQAVLFDAMARKVRRVLGGFAALTSANYTLAKQQLLTVRVASTQIAEQIAEELVSKALREGAGEPELYARLCGDVSKALTHFVSSGAPGKHARPRHAFLEALQALCGEQLRRRDALTAAVLAPTAAGAGAGQGAAAAPIPAAAPASTDGSDPWDLRRTQRLAALAWHLRQGGLLVETEGGLRASLQALLLEEARPGPAAVGMACQLLASLGQETAKATAKAASPAGVAPPPPPAACVDATGPYSCRLQGLLSRPSLEPSSRAAIQEVLHLRANGWVARNTAPGMAAMATEAAAAGEKAHPGH